MAQTFPACPKCGQSDKTYKVSLVYLESSARLNHHDDGNQPELDGLLADLSAGTATPDGQKAILSRLIAYFSPPTGSKHNTRRIHPDSMVVFFGLLCLLMVYQVAVSQSRQLPIIMILLTGSVLVYLLTRRTIIKRYDDRARKESEENERIETALTHWMRLYFCSRDQGVFDPEQNRYAPLEQMSEILKKE